MCGSLLHLKESSWFLNGLNYNKVYESNITVNSKRDYSIHVTV